MIGFKDSKKAFTNYLNKKGIAHTHAGGSVVTMDKENVEKLKKSMLNLDRNNSSAGQ